MTSLTHEPFISAKAAAKFVGFEPGDGAARRDPAMRAFYEWVSSHRVPKHQRGSRCLVFRVSELEAAILHGEPPDEDSGDRMAALAHAHVRGVFGGRRP